MKGRIDLTLKFNNRVYIFEFKVDKVKGKPLEQIKEKKYYEKYLSKNNEVYIIGIIFDIENRNIKEFVWENVENR